MTTKVESKTVSITHTISMGWNIAKGESAEIKRVYHRNGETQLSAIHNGVVKEIPACWTNVKFI